MLTAPACQTMSRTQSRSIRRWSRGAVTMATKLPDGAVGALTDRQVAQLT
jgi:hypothetical protein